MTALGTDWVEIGALDEIPSEGARVVKTSHGCIAVFRTAADEVYALDDRCPHKGGPLAQGIVHGRSVTCPLHNWVIDLETGKALGADEGRVRTTVARVQDGKVLLDRAVLARREA